MTWILFLHITAGLFGSCLIAFCIAWWIAWNPNFEDDEMWLADDDEPDFWNL